MSLIMMVISIKRDAACLLNRAANHVFRMVVPHLVFLSILGIELIEYLIGLRIVHELSVQSFVVLVS